MTDITVYDTKTILAFGLFTLEKSAKITRELLYQWLALASLAAADLEKGLTLDELRDRVAEDLAQLPGGNPQGAMPVIQEKTLVEAMTHAERGKLVRKDEREPRYWITEGRRAALEQAKQVYLANRQCLAEHISGKIAAFLPDSEITPALLELVVQEAERLVEKAFCVVPFETSQEWLMQSDQVENRDELQAARGALDELSNRLREVTTAEGRPMPLSQSVEVANAVKEAFEDLPRCAVRHIISLHHRTLYSYILRQEPSLQKFDRMLLAKRTLYLDTNVLLPYLFAPHLEHESVEEVLNLSKQLGCKLRVSPLTISEIKRLLEGTKKRFDFLLEKDMDPESIRSLIRQEEGPVIMQYLRTAARPTKKGFAAFIKTCQQLEPTLHKKGIVIEGPSEDTILKHEHFQRVRQQLQKVLEHKREYQKRHGRTYQPNDAILDHDTGLLLTAHHLRTHEQNRPDVMGSRVWVLSRDRHGILEVQRQLLDIFPRPAVRWYAEWGEFVTQFITPDFTSLRLDDYVKVLLDSKLGLIPGDPMANGEFTEPVRRNDIISPFISEMPKDTIAKNLEVLSAKNESGARVDSREQDEEVKKEVVEEFLTMQPRRPRPPRMNPMDEMYNDFNNRLSDLNRKFDDISGALENLEEMLKQQATANQPVVAGTQKVKRAHWIGRVREWLLGK